MPVNIPLVYIPKKRVNHWEHHWEQSPTQVINCCKYTSNNNEQLPSKPLCGSDVIGGFDFHTLPQVPVLNIVSRRGF